MNDVMTDQIVEAMTVTKEMRSEFKQQLSQIKNNGKRRRVARDVKRNLQAKYGVTF